MTLTKLSTCLLLIFTATLFAQETTAPNLFGKDVHAAKKEIIKSNIKIANETQSKQFWSIYDNYETNSQKESEAYTLFLKKYSGLSAVMTAEAADAIANELFRIHTARQKLLTDVYKRMRKEISPAVAARFMMIENRVSLLEDFQAVSANPLALPEGERVFEVRVE